MSSERSLGPMVPGLERVIYPGRVVEEATENTTSTRHAYLGYSSQRHRVSIWTRPRGEVL
jgi:hypothetical protein